MKKFVCIQAGHYGRTTGATGTAGEQELNWRITLRLSEILQSKGVMIQIVGADPKDSELQSDFDLFISLHGDMDTAGEGGCIGSGDPSVDVSWKESARIRDVIASVYFPESGIKNVPNKVTNAIRFYYMWPRLTAKTPCVLLEMGEVKDPHDSVILADTERVAVAIAKGICKAFGIDYEPPAQPTPTPPSPSDPCEAIKKELADTKKALSDAQKSYSASLALKDEECKKKLESYKSKIADGIKNVLDITQ